MFWLLLIVALVMMVDGALGMRGRASLFDRAAARVWPPLGRWLGVAFYFGVAALFLGISIEAWRP
jgi:hypothetical protein